MLRFGINGLFADPLDTMDLAITMLKPLQYRPLAERLSRRGAQLLRGPFTWTAVAQQVIRATERTAGEQSRSVDGALPASEPLEN
jgi:hypothetical protein